MSAQILALISQHATSGECEKTSYDDFYIEVQPCASQLSAAAAWLPPVDTEVHILGGSSFTALPATLKQAVQVSSHQRALRSSAG